MSSGRKKEGERTDAHLSIIIPGNPLAISKQIVSLGRCYKLRPQNISTILNIKVSYSIKNNQALKVLMSKGKRKWWIEV